MAEEETRLATEYAERYEIQSTFVNALTNLFKKHPDDPMGFLYDQIVPKAAAPIINKVVGREVLDSQGYPVLEVEVWGRVYGKPELLSTASSPSADCPPSDAFVMVDASASRFHHMGVRQSVSLVTSALQPVLENRQFSNQSDLDESISTCDGTPNFKKLGVNTSMSTSAAIAIAASEILRIPLFIHISRSLSHKSQLSLPRPCFALLNIKSGPISRVYLLPSPTVPIDEQVRIIGEIYSHYEQSIHSPLCADGCFPLEAAGLDDILASIEIAVSGGGHTLGDDVFLGFCGSSEATPQFWLDLLEQSSVVAFIEDPIMYDDSINWKKIVSALGDKGLVAMGKGIYSRPERISNELECSAVIIKPPQVGTITKAVQAADKAEKCSRRIVMSTSSRETHNTWICDLAVATGATLLLLGPPARGENVAKINRLLEIAREMEIDYN